FVSPVIVQIDDLVLDHSRISNHPLSPALMKQLFFEPEQIAVFVVELAGNAAPHRLEFFTPIQPSQMGSIAGSINIAPSDALETHQNVTPNFIAHLFQFVGKPDW